jgi:uncharacterized membrane protein YeaQ/YmgE (transglycosylase-associated protein family)
MKIRDPDTWAFIAMIAIVAIVAAHRLVSIASKRRLRFPWIIVGTLTGFLVGLFFMPAEARIGIPIHYAARPVGGAIAGAVIGAILEARHRNHPKISNRE